MHIKLAAIGEKLPLWADTACADYAKRIDSKWKLEIQALPLSKLHKNDPARATKQENDALLDASKGLFRIALHSTGTMATSITMAKKLDSLAMTHGKIAFLIGGPDGLLDSTLAECSQIWSLSKLTFPHALARVMLLEQLYRCWSMKHRISYHR